jgi:hypothetical protein
VFTGWEVLVSAPCRSNFPQCLVESSFEDEGLSALNWRADKNGDDGFKG